MYLDVRAVHVGMWGRFDGLMYEERERGRGRRVTMMMASWEF